MNKTTITGGTTLLLLMITAAGLIFDISPVIWLPALVVVIVFGAGLSRSRSGRDVER